MHSRVRTSSRLRFPPPVHQVDKLVPFFVTHLTGRTERFRPNNKRHLVAQHRARLQHRRRRRGSRPRTVPRQRGQYRAFRQSGVRRTTVSYSPVLSLGDSCRTDSCLRFLVRQTLIGELDEDLDKSIDLSQIRAEPIGEIVH